MIYYLDKQRLSYIPDKPLSCLILVSSNGDWTYGDLLTAVHRVPDFYSFLATYPNSIMGPITYFQAICYGLNPNKAE